MCPADNYQILDLDRVGFRYAGYGDLIRDLDLSIGNGEFIGLLGANGSGKSTILGLASGLLKPREGDIYLWGKPLRSYRNRDRAKLICYLPQMLDISVPFRVRELVGMGLYPYDIPPAISVGEALEMVGLIEKADCPVATLSGGEKRRTFIAMTLLQGAGLLLLDEPLANLDIKYQIELLRLLGELKDMKDISIMMSLHDINMALRFEKVILVKEGKVLCKGAPEEVLTGGALEEAFDIAVEMKKDDRGRAYIRYEDNFRKHEQGC